MTAGCVSLRAALTIILAIFYPPLKYIRGCGWLFLQAQEGTIYFTELAERVEYGNYDDPKDGKLDKPALCCPACEIHYYFC